MRAALALVFGLLVAGIVAELGARLLESAAPGGLVARIGERIDDPVLDYRTAPGSGENDAAGHRNPTRLDRADVVALGDSQTWGVNADMDETWPARLAERADLAVYNMGRGGYGIVQYRHQLDDALALEPAWVVVALYFGNDIYDAYALAYSRDAHERLRHPDEDMRQRIAESTYPDLQRMFFGRVNHGADPKPNSKPNSKPRPGWLAEHSALVRMVARVSDAPADSDRDRSWAEANPDEGFVYDDGRISTVFHTRYRLAAVDSGLPKIREGLRITLKVLGELAKRVEQQPGTRLLVVLLPTKERVLAPAIHSSEGTDVTTAAPPADYRRSVREEARISAGLTSRMDRLGIQHLDMLPLLEAAVERGEAIFPPNVDGHFTPLGYDLIAEAVAEVVAESFADQAR